MTKASPNPFGPAAGNSMPLMAAAGSVVGRPWESTAQSSGMRAPAAAARRILPIAVALNAMSASAANSPAEGSAMAMGLLPTSASAPPGGAEMKAVAHGNRREPDLPRPLDRELERLPRGQLPERVAGIDDDRGAAI